MPVKTTIESTSTKYLPSSIKDECFYAWGLTVDQQPLMYYGLHLQGNLDHEVMKSALRASLEVHPKLRCVLTREPSFWKRSFRFTWQRREMVVSDILKTLPASEHGIDPSREAHYYRDLILKHSMDVSKEPGLKILLITGDEESLLLFAFHHAVTDGRGGLNFIETFISEYNAIYFKKKTAQKGAPNDAYPQKSVHKQCIDAVKSFSYMARHQYRAFKEPLIKVTPKTQMRGSEKPLVVARKVESEEFKNIRARAKKRSARFADLLLAGIYLTVRKWNSRCGDDASGRISFFASVGVLQGDPKSVGNITSGMIIDLLTEDNSDKNQILTNIAKAQDAFLKHGDIYGFLSIFTLMPIPLRLRALRRVLKRLRFEHNRRFPTMRVANLGMLQTTNFSPDDEALVGDAKPQNIILSPANINEVPFLLFHTYKKHLYIYLAVLQSTFSEESAEEFLALLVQELLAF